MPRASNAVALAATLAWLSACNAPTPAQAPAPADAGTEAAPPAASVDAIDAPPPMQDQAAAPSDAPAPDAPAFVATVWKVVESDGVQAGTTYTFNADGSLVIASAPGNPPGRGKWTYADGKLAIEEDGVTYPTDIVRLDASHFDIRSHNPGGTLDIQMVPAAPR